MLALPAPFAAIGLIQPPVIVPSPQSRRFNEVSVELYGALAQLTTRQGI
jgi:hypothetical protein